MDLEQQERVIESDYAREAKKCKTRLASSKAELRGYQADLRIAVVQLVLKQDVAEKAFDLIDAMDITELSIELCEMDIERLSILQQAFDEPHPMDPRRDSNMSPTTYARYLQLLGDISHLERLIKRRWNSHWERLEERQEMQEMERQSE